MEIQIIESDTHNPSNTPANDGTYTYTIEIKGLDCQDEQTAKAIQGKIAYLVNEHGIDVMILPKG
jgi:hypothetical protein